MGRKIPVRKHKGVRNPAEQRKQREFKLKNAREDAPPNVNDQPISKKLAKILELSKLVEEGKFKPKKQKDIKPPKKIAGSVKENVTLLKSDDFAGSEGHLEPGMKRPIKSLPTLQQRPGEKKRTFMYRVNQWCDGLLKESKFENQFGVDIVRNPETGQVQSVEKRAKDEIDIIAQKEVKKARDAAQTGKKGKSKKREAEAAAAKEEKKKKSIMRMKRKREKIIEKAVRREEEKDEFPGKETIKFGEVVDRPPEFTVLPRRAIDEKNLKNLMFNQMLIQGKTAMKEPDVKKNEGKAPKKGSTKLKDLSPGERRIVEQQQKAVIAAYRLMKAKKAKE